MAALPAGVRSISQTIVDGELRVVLALDADAETALRAVRQTADHVHGFLVDAGYMPGGIKSDLVERTVTAEDSPGAPDGASATRAR